MLFVMAIDLYMVRVVLNSLGAVDYGIFDVVAGVVLMFQSVSSVLVISTQRFYSYELGRKDESNLQGVFTSSVNIYLLLSLLIVLICETVGVWFVNTHLTIPAERLTAANWVFQFSIFSFIFTILQIPYSAAVIANEDMGIFSIVSILNCILKLICALFIASVAFDKLGYYGAYLFVISFVIFIIYFFVAHKKYKWCHYELKKAHQHLDIIKFSGWTFWGTTANVGITQVCTILVNMFFGPVVNAARAVSFQINSAINSFCGSFLMAIRPPMIKAYAEENYPYLNKLFESSNKIVCYSLLLVCLPLFFEMDTVLFYWLNTNDPQTFLFSRLIVIYAFILSLNSPITFIIHAAGRVKEYHVLVEIPTLLCAPITYLLFKIGCPAYTTYLTMIGAVILSHIIRLLCLKRFYTLFNLGSYIKSFCIPALLITLLCSLVCLLLHNVIQNDFLRIMAVVLVNALVLSLLIYLIGINNQERDMLLSEFKKRTKRVAGMCNK